MSFLLSVLMHPISWNKQANLETIRRNMSGVVNVKLAQFLSNFEHIVGKEVANEFKRATHDAPPHDVRYSAQVVREDFGDAYDLTDSTIIGSGSMAQIHKLADADIVIKVVHPDAVKEVQQAVAGYRSIQDSMFLSSNLKVVCDVFFDGLEQQLDMRREYANAQHFHQDDLYVRPTRIACSERCLVMSYEPSLHLSDPALPPNVVRQACDAINRYSGICIERGWIHADMHQGNFGVRHTSDDLERIVVYDFGFVHDLTDEIDNATRHEIVQASHAYDFERHKNAMIRFMGIDSYDTAELDLTPELKPFCDNVERLILYYFATCTVNATSFKLFSSMGQYVPYLKQLME